MDADTLSAERPKRKIVAITMVKNEMDIIESFVRHTLGFADLLIVADHKSTDRTREILEALRAEGLPILVGDVEEARHVQAETMTRLLWMAADTYQADIVLPLDTDEFLVPTGDVSVRDILEALPVAESRSLRMQMFLPASDKGLPAGVFPFVVPFLRDTVPGRVQKVLVNGAAVRQTHLRLGEGNHEIIHPTPEGMRAAHGPLCEGMELAHLYWRSPAQFQSKCAVAWPNIAAKYGVNAYMGGGYAGLFENVRMRQIPARNTEGFAPCNLHGRVPLPELRYSADAIPDVLANVMAASEALAEELAETRALASEPMVSTIIPYTYGGYLSQTDEPFRRSLDAALAERYPWHEIIVPICSRGGSLAFLQEAARKGVRLVAPENLSSAVQGDYVEWLLPGETVRPEKLRCMVTCMELQDLSLPVLLSGSGQKHPVNSPYTDFPVSASENLRMTSFSSFWHQLLVLGLIPSHGLSGLLVRREVFEACSGLLDSFAEGSRPQVFSMWRMLLSAVRNQENIGIVHRTYAGPSMEPRLEDLAVHQLDWYACCQKDRMLLNATEQRDVLDRQRRIGIDLLERAMRDGCDMQSGIWPAYQQMLASL